MTWSGEGFRQLGRRHWQWRGTVPGEVGSVRSAVRDALELARPVSMTEPNESTIVARVGGTIRASFAATEEITVVVSQHPGGGSDLEIRSRSLQLTWSDGGRNRAAIERLLLTLGIR